MAPAVSGDERDAAALDLADVQRGRGGPERRLDLDLLDVVEEGVEAGSPEDADVRLRQADFSFVPSVAGAGESPPLASAEAFDGSFVFSPGFVFSPAFAFARESVA